MCEMRRKLFRQHPFSLVSRPAGDYVIENLVNYILEQIVGDSHPDFIGRLLWRRIEDLACASPPNADSRFKILKRTTPRHLKRLQG